MGMLLPDPCPYRGWEEDNRYAMLNMFPLIGTALGVLVSVVWWLLSLLGAWLFRQAPC